jgi:hypothetical protein
MSRRAKQRADDSNSRVLGTSGEQPLGTPKNIAGWTIRRTKRGYFESVRRIDGKLIYRHLGRRLDVAHKILSATVEPPTTPTVQAATIQAGKAEHVEREPVAGPEPEILSKVRTSEESTRKAEQLPCKGRQWCVAGEWCHYRRECGPGAQR